jgi:hypothetical protein
MSSNPYAPPQSEVKDIGGDQNEQSKKPLYFPISFSKFIVMNFGTFGLYRIYWFYQNWKLIKEREGRDIVPIARAIFQIFFAYSLFKHIRDETERRDLAPSLSAGLIFSLWIPLIVVSQVPGPLSLLTFAAVFLFLPVQNWANKVNAHAAPDHDRNSRLVGWNWAAILIGIPLLVLAAISLTEPVEIELDLPRN